MAKVPCDFCGMRVEADLSVCPYCSAPIIYDEKPVSASQQESPPSQSQPVSPPAKALSNESSNKKPDSAAKPSCTVCWHELDPDGSCPRCSHKLKPKPPLAAEQYRDGGGGRARIKVPHPKFTGIPSQTMVCKSCGGQLQGYAQVSMLRSFSGWMIIIFCLMACLGATMETSSRAKDINAIISMMITLIIFANNFKNRRFFYWGCVQCESIYPRNELNQSGGCLGRIVGAVMSFFYYLVIFLFLFFASSGIN